MTIRLPEYSGKDYLVLALVLVPITLIINSTIFSKNYFSGIGFFTAATLLTAIVFTFYFILCGGIAVFFKKHFHRESDMGKKLALMIFFFLLLTGLVMLLLFRGYESIAFFHYTFNKDGFVWAYISLGMINIFLTFLFEGIARFENWKSNLRETEALRKAYQQSQLEGLKSQVNPHFLFNSLNSLSSLIQEDEAAAEIFLDEMSKVYRYMLRNDDDQLVTLAIELSFLHAYMHLLNARFGNGLQLIIDVTATDKEKLLPPLTLQVIVENAFTQNIVSKSQPLCIKLYTSENFLFVENSIQPKIISDAIDFKSGLDNLVKKYTLLNHGEVVVDNTTETRTIRLPLISGSKEVHT